MKKKLLVTLLALSLAAGSLAPVSPLDNTAVVAEAAKKKPKKKTATTTRTSRSEKKSETDFVYFRREDSSY